MDRARPRARGIHAPSAAAGGAFSCGASVAHSPARAGEQPRASRDFLFVTAKGQAMRSIFTVIGVIVVVLVAINLIA
jgi:hypothetical protein